MDWRVGEYVCRMKCINEGKEERNEKEEEAGKEGRQPGREEVRKEGIREGRK
jgi:hypothetical protein